ncbi:MAG: alpha/beta hydrolase family protein [Gemmatimonadales bacterium]
MATATLTRTSLPGALGPILVDVRTSSRTTPQPAVVIVHGFKGFKDYAFLPPLAERLARAGFTAISLSVSGSGVDEAGEFTLLERFARNTYTREMADIEQVIAEAVAGKLGFVAPASLGLVGHSRGGGVVLCVARETPAVAAVVAWSPISTIRRYSDAEVALWRRLGRIEARNARTGQSLPMDYEIVEDALANADRFDIEKAAATLDRPWLLLHGTEDETVPVAESHHLARLATDPRFESIFIEGAGHTFGARHPWSGPTPETELLFDATVRFLSRHLS